MTTRFPAIETSCREQLTRFFSQHPNDDIQKRAMKTLQFLTAGDEPVTGKPEGWAAGIIYFVVNQFRHACGIPGLLNSEFESFFGVSMGTARRRAARIAQALTI